MTSSERGRKRRKLLRAAGSCLDCGAEKAPERTRCLPCGQRNARAAKARFDRRRAEAERAGGTIQ